MLGMPAALIRAMRTFLPSALPSSLRTVATGLVAASLAMGATGCGKMKLTAKATGYKTGSATTMLVHLVGEKGARVTCSSANITCAPAEIGFNGETDMEVDLSATTSEKGSRILFVKAQRGRREASVMLDLETALPPTVSVASSGDISCIGRKCDGNILIADSRVKGHFPPATTVQVGSAKLVANAAGDVDAPVSFGLRTAPKDILLSKLCTSTSTSFGSTDLTLTFPDGAKAVSPVDLTTERVWSELAPRFAAGGPALFPWEKPGAIPASKRRAAILYAQSRCVAGGSADATLGDVGVFVVSTPAARTRADVCVYQLNVKATGASRGVATAKLTLHDEQATAYDRVSGRKLGTRAFQAAHYCTSNVSLSSASENIPDQDAYVDDKAVVGWAATLGR